MESGRRRSSSHVDDDEMALVKAAAWAWYQRGARNEAQPPREFVLSRPHHRPTRYKLEALRAAETPPRSESSLLDLHEIQWITHELDRLVASTNSRARRRDGAPSRLAPGFWGRHAAEICWSASGVVEWRAAAGQAARGRRARR